MEKNWSGLSKDFDERQKYVAGEDVVRLISERIQRLKDLGRVLELGCGNGFYTQFLEESASQVLATDISNDMVAAARNKLAGFPNIRVESADAYETGYIDCSFDTIFMANLIHVVEHPDKLLAESKRILKKQGRLIISSFTTYRMGDKEIEEMFKRYLRAFGQPPRAGRSYTLDSLQELLVSFGFKTEEAVLIEERTTSIFMISRNSIEDTESSIGTPGL